MAQQAEVKVTFNDLEMRYLGYLAEGLVYKEMAHKETVSHETVKTHLKRLYNKLDARNGAQAVAQAFRSGVLQ